MFAHPVAVHQGYYAPVGLEERGWVTPPKKHQHEPMWINSWPSTAHQEQGGLQGSKHAMSNDGHQHPYKAGQLERLLDEFWHMDKQGTVPSGPMCWSLLKECNRRKTLTLAKQVHAHLALHGVECTSLLGEYLVCTLVKFVGLEDGVRVFNTLPCRTVISWTAMISGYTDCGKGLEALKTYQSMREQGVEPNGYTFVSLLKVCGSIPDLEKGEAIHADARRKCLDKDAFVAGALMRFYSNCGNIMEAENVFGGLPQRNIISWNGMLSAYLEQGEGQKILHQYIKMQDEGVIPDEWTFVIALKACCKIFDNEEDATVERQPLEAMFLEVGQALHADVRRKGLDAHVFVGSTLVSMYGKFGSIIEAENVICGLPQCNVVTWNAMLSAYIEQGEGERVLQLYKQIQEEGISPNERTFVIALQACCMLAEKGGPGYVRGGSNKAVALEIGRALHGDARRKGFDSNAFFSNSLVSMYGKCGSIVEAEDVFGRLSECEVVSWNVMLSAYVDQDEAEKALLLHKQMQEKGMSLDKCTFVVALQACCMLAEKEGAAVIGGQSIKVVSLEVGQTLHFDVCTKGFDLDAFIGSTLVSMYGKCGCILEAECVFHSLSHHDVVSWTAMLSAYVEQGEGEKAIQFFRQMEEDGVIPNEWSFAIALQACCVLADKEEALVADGLWTKVLSLETGQVLHAAVVRQGADQNDFVSSALLRMYGKCGSIKEAKSVFSGLSKHDIMPCNALISAFVELGEAEKALHTYKQILEEGVSPDMWTFVIAIQASCMLAENEGAVVVEGHVVKEMALKVGRALHVSAKTMGFDSDVFVGSVLVSMYGKCRSIVEAENVFGGLLKLDVESWNTMLSVYVKQGEEKKALQLFNQMLKECASLNEMSFVTVLQAGCMLAEMEETVVEGGRLIKTVSLEIAQVLHAEAWKRGFDLDSCVASSLISMYSKCGSIVEAETVYSGLPQHNIMSQNAMILAYVEQRDGKKALQLYKHMQEEGVGTNEQTFVAILQAWCVLAEKQGDFVVGEQSAEVATLEIGQALHDDARLKGFDSGLVVGTMILSMYGKCGNIVEAESVFSGLPQRDLVSWNAMLSVYVEQCEGEKALHLHKQLQEEGLSPNERTFVIVLQACYSMAEKEGEGDMEGLPTKVMPLETGRALHSDALMKGLDSDVFLGATLICMYGKCGSILEAERVFCVLPQEYIMPWTAMISVYVKQGDGEKALHIYKQMEEIGTSANLQTFLLALQACCMLAEKEGAVVVQGQFTKVLSLEIGQTLHAEGQRKGFDSDVHIGSTLVGLYGKCGTVMELENVFARLPYHNVVSWNAMLSAYVELGEIERALRLFRQMQEEGMTDERTFAVTLQACCMQADNKGVAMVDINTAKLASWKIGQAIHTDARSNGYDSDLFVCSTLISMYGKCGSVVEAENVFYGFCLCCQDAMLWNAMLSAYVEQGEVEKALQLYKKMQEQGICPQELTFVIALQACCVLAEREGVLIVEGRLTKVMSLNIGQALHADAERKGFSSSVFVGSTLVSMYGKCGNTQEAEMVFIGLSQRTVVPWTAMLSAFVEQGEGGKALQMYRKMEEECVSPNERTYVMALKACGMIAEKESSAVVQGGSMKVMALEICKALHEDAWRKGFPSDVFIANILMTTYGKCGSILEAEKVFGGLSQPDTVSWNALLSAYIEQGQGEAVLQLYKRMQDEHTNLDDITLSYILQACGETGTVEICRQLHFTIVSSGSDSSLLVTATLIHVYGSCASMNDAQAVFDTLLWTDAASWSSLMSGYAREGNPVASLQRFEEMKLMGIIPTDIAFFSLIAACSHAGLVNKGVDYFESMAENYGLTPKVGHFATVIDLLGRAGDLRSLDEILSRMLMQMDSSMLLCLLGACQKHHNLELGKRVFDHAVRLQPKLGALYVLMSNMYAEDGLLDSNEELLMNSLSSYRGIDHTLMINQ